MKSSSQQTGESPVSLDELPLPKDESIAFRIIDAISIGAVVGSVFLGNCVTSVALKWSTIVLGTTASVLSGSYWKDRLKSRGSRERDSL